MTRQISKFDPVVTLSCVGKKIISGGPNPVISCITNDSTASIPISDVIVPVPALKGIVTKATLENVIAAKANQMVVACIGSD